MPNAQAFYASIRDELQSIRDAGLYKNERVIATPQGARVRTSDGREVINLCANNYLGLSSHPRVIEAAHEALRTHGFGLSSVRFICGTQDLHKSLEARLSSFLGTEDAILYGSAFDANGGLFETLLGAEDAVISDALNHASIIDGIRLSKARRYRYQHNDMEDLRAQLEQARADGARYTLVFSDGVFSMDGTVARLDAMRALCDEYGALLGIDECHATGFMGPRGRGTHEARGVFGKVDIITGTLGKALGGASGGFTSARKEVVALLRQRSRPYLFSNTVAPAIVGASIAVLDILEASTELRDRLERNTTFFRAGLDRLGFDVKAGDHPIIPIMVYDADKAQQLAQRLLELGVYVVGFFYPVVPKGQARIRVQMSALHDEATLQAALDAFGQAGRELGLI
ncbi:glycine C-acetyltransferase [Cupriavidus taiwanensis]|uniref:2-amino-3-ketobutyrate coenzyme A ligase n=1 Tax=Cupriavidus taiwanensis TaxID=164546 RepID=A0A7Z7JCX5_9BURK|nr:glycine C-acetyltransferase [Cupriavidus taiwanensis]SOZ09998.1 2-amino-3-ketobutyrate CoA ligase (glycine acetyltransferase) [Cupriavidus taiwanensis]SOZ12166.1 2-amino-3-ketobutyrate CoA ligase (glycine acetyltransferase) [Cupriavidus taiwanensis]SOZ43471.1 2-amino-3-ketobutyrate CoA ligase (glycine acetyltransferase) [Cupriavidus taiwanensis]SPC22713.1 2-amino-3-ketobutyrate CoA ligase (glycine acetyltransferase) [Cupriavidus taiwanensis]SPD54224.1 glycine C-acetyltransferase [Cupriavidu